MDAEGGVGVVEADDEADAELVLAHRVDEAAAELVVLRRLAQRPAHRVDHAVERLGDLPDLFHAELPAHRVGAVQVEVVVGGVGEVADRALGKDGRLGDDVGARLEVAQLLALLAATAVAGADALDHPILDQQLGRGGLGEDVDAGFLGFVGEEAAQLGDRSDVVAVVAEVRRHRLQRQRRLRGQQVDRVLGDLLEDRPLLLGQVGEELFHRRGLHVRPGEQVRARYLALLDHRDRDFAELLGQLRLVLEQLHDLVGAGEPGGPASDDRDADLDPLVLRVGRRADHVGRVERRRELAWRYCRHRLLQSFVGSCIRGAGAPGRRQPFLALIASVSLGTILCRSPTTPRSENSKIGAFWSLLIARMFSELCIPTLCWIAPEMPAAR